MSVLGLITEYNPFHNGHLYHLNESKKVTNADYSVCIMSGNFIQRGEPALIDKWVRAKMAIKAGIDLVIELPVTYSIQSAELFAFGAIKLLDSLGIVDGVCFGSEAGNVEVLDRISSILIEEPENYKILLKQNLNTGLPFPQARANALIKVLNGDLKDILNSSNNILGIEYLKALKRLNSSIKPYTIKRVKNEYNSTIISDNIASATSIRRKLIETGDVGTVKDNIPDTTFDRLLMEFSQGKGPVFSHHFDNLIISIIRKMPLEKIRDIFDVNEGLENRIKKASMKVSTIEDLVKSIKTKRYTQTRIQRILFHALLGIEKKNYEEFSSHGGPQYIRILGFNENGKKLLNIAKKKASLPIITKVANHTNTVNPILNKMLQYDITATNLYTLTYANPEFRIGDLDFTHGVIIE